MGSLYASELVWRPFLELSEQALRATRLNIYCRAPYILEDPLTTVWAEPNSHVACLSGFASVRGMCESGMRFDGDGDGDGDG